MSSSHMQLPLLLACGFLLPLDADQCDNVYHESVHARARHLLEAFEGVGACSPCMSHGHRSGQDCVLDSPVSQPLSPRRHDDRLWPRWTRVLPAPALLHPALSIAAVGSATPACAWSQRCGRERASPSASGTHLPPCLWRSRRLQAARLSVMRCMPHPAAAFASRGRCAGGVSRSVGPAG